MLDTVFVVSTTFVGIALTVLVKIALEPPYVIVVSHWEEVVAAGLLPTEAAANCTVMVADGATVGTDPSARGSVVVMVTSPLIINSTVGATTTSVVVEYTSVTVFVVLAVCTLVTICLFGRAFKTGKAVVS